MIYERDMLISLAIMLAALLLDRMLGEPRVHHPLVLFGNLANRLERHWNQGPDQNPDQSVSRRTRGLVAWLLAVGLITLVFALADGLLRSVSETLHLIASAVVLYLCIGWQSLKEHMLAIHRPLEQDNLSSARQACAMVVSRDTDHLSAGEIAKAAVESTLENGSDGIFAALFWFALLGIPGVVLYRLSNTLDAMWGYRTDRFAGFGWWAAKADDVLNWIPARITAFFYMLSPLVYALKPAMFAGNSARTKPTFAEAMALIRSARNNWLEQAPLLASPNGGPVMVTGATVLNIKLGGPARYHGELQDKAFFGGAEPAAADDIPRALALVNLALSAWVALGALLAAVL